MGNYKKGSDVDLVIYGSGITEQIVSRLSSLKPGITAALFL
ncbi:MAG: hypothetical protein ACOX6E_01390 [Syntrophomonadaceae bacterium]